MQVTAEGGPLPTTAAASATAGTNNVGQRGSNTSNKHAALVARVVKNLLRLLACVVATAGGLVAAATMTVRARTNMCMRCGVGVGVVCSSRGYFSS